MQDGVHLLYQGSWNMPASAEEDSTPSSISRERVRLDALSLH